MDLEPDALYVGGTYRRPHGRDRLRLINPATAEPLGSVPVADRVDVDQAVNAARQAASEWASAPSEERALIIENVARELDLRSAEIAAAVTSENGTPITQSARLNGSAPSRFYRYFSSIAETATRRTELRGDSRRTIVERTPHQVSAIIVPWNSPLALLAAKLAPALAAGSTAVIKPAVETSLDIQLVCDAFDSAGVPAGVINVVTGGAGTGKYLIEHPFVDKVSFTGSTQVGREVGAACGAALKSVSLELGGKSAAVVLDDADLEVFCRSILTVCLPNTGQICWSTSRILVPRAMRRDVVDAMISVLAASPVGDPTDEATAFGPLVSERQRDRVEGYIQSGIEEGARVTYGGHRIERRGYFLEPTLFTDVDSAMSIAKDEIFGPVLCVQSYDGDDEAVRIANDSEYGLAGAVYSADPCRALAVAHRLDTGSVGINGYQISIDAPLSSRKASGGGVDFGVEAVHSYTQLKSTYVMQR